MKEKINREALKNMARDYTKELGFWKRLQSFVENIQISDYPGEEEKTMILHNCKLKIKYYGRNMGQLNAEQ